MEDGSLKAVGKNAEKAAAGLDKASRSSDNYNKKQKGVAGISSNSTKNFSKMTTGITDGLVPAYATLAANVFALTAAFNLLARNDAIAKLQEGLEFTGRAAGRNLTLVADKLKEITDNAISAEQAMRTTAVGISAGFSETQMEGLAKVAKGAALALGRDMGDAMDRLTRGAAKLEPEILDELGIMVRLDDAVSDYALAHNKATSELTQFERRMAFTNAIIDQGTKKYADLAGALEPSAYSKLASTFSDLTKTVIGFLNSALSPVLNFLAETPAALGAIAAAFGASLTGQIMGGLQGMAEKSAEAAKRTNDVSKASLKNIKTNKLLSKGYNELVKSGDRSNKTLNDMIGRLDATIRTTTKNTAKLKEAKIQRKDLTKEIYLQNVAVAKNTSANAMSTLQTQGFTAALRLQIQALREVATANAAAAAQSGILGTAMFTAKTGATALGMGIRFVGASILVAMPYVAAFMALFSLLGPLFKKFFGDNSKLGEALEKNEERLAEFDNVAKQYVETIGSAQDSTEAWIKTLEPLSGLLAETYTSLQTTYSAATLDNILKVEKAITAVKEAEARLNDPENEFLYDMFAGVVDAGTVQQGQKVIDAGTALSQEQLDKLAENSKNTVQKLIGTLNVMREGLKDFSEKEGVAVGNTLALIDRHQQKVTTAFAVFQSQKTESSYRTLAEAIKTSRDSTLAAVDAFKTFNETVKQAKTLVGDPKATLGPYAKELDNIEVALNKLKSVGKEGGINPDQAIDILKAYGVDVTGIKNLKEGQKVLVLYENTMEEVNKSLLKIAEAQSKFAVKEAVGGRTIQLAKEELKIAEDLVKTRFTEFNQVTLFGQAKIDAQKKYNDALREEVTLRIKLFEELSKEAEKSGMGAGAAASIAYEGRVKSAVTPGERQKLQAEQARAGLAGVAKDIAAIGPEGALMSSVIDGALNMETAFKTAFEVISDDSNDMSTRVQAGLGAIGATVSALGAMQKAASDQRIAAIDNEIAAEKARDGKSAGSVAKLAALEKKKEQAKRKAFEQDKKMKMAQTVISTAQGVTAMLGAAPPPVNFALAAMVAAMGAQQLAMISSSSFAGGAGAAASTTPSSIAVGSRNASVDLAKGQNAGGELAYMRGASGTGGIENFQPAFAGYKNRAAGGFVVGEQGPELFMPEVPGEIIPSGKDAGGTTNVNFSISAVDATGVEDLLLNQRGNIIGMIREAANEHGEFFLESVQEKSY